MKAILIALAALSLVSVATPASAQDGWRDRDHRRHDNDWRRHHRSGITVDVGRSYARSNCAVKVTKIHRSNGTTVTRRVRSCD
jgi:Ni/Co efflux regulator RcnB